MRARSHIFARTHALPGSRQARRGEDGRLVAAAEPIPLPGTACFHPPVWVWLGSLDGLRSAPLACASTCHSCGVVRPCAPLCGRTHALRAGLIGCLFACLRARSLTAAAVCPTVSAGTGLAVARAAVPRDRSDRHIFAHGLVAAPRAAEDLEEAFQGPSVPVRLFLAGSFVP